MNYNEKILLIICCLGLIFTGCNKEERYKLMDQVVTINADTVYLKTGEQNSIQIKINAGYLDYNVTGIPSWLDINSSNGGVSASNPTTIWMTANSVEPSNINKEADIFINTSIMSFKVHLVVFPESYTNSICPKSINFNQNTNSIEISLLNTFIPQMKWNASVENDWIKLSQNSGTLEQNKAFKITVNLDREQLPSQGEFKTKIQFLANNTSYETEVLIQNYGDPKLLGFDVIEATYSAALNKLVFVSAGVPAIHLYDVDSDEIQTYPLQYIPTCLFVNEKGTIAVIGHDAKVTVFDLTARKVSKSIDVDCKAIDVLYTSNNYVYVFPERDQWTTLRCINVANGNVQHHIGNQIYAGSKGGLHPSEKWIYVTDNFISPSDVKKFDISAGNAEFMYDSPYHGEHILGNDVWMHPDGKKLFSGQTFLSCESVQSNDLLYRGKINLSQNILNYNLVSSYYLETSRNTYYTAFPYNPNFDTGTNGKIFQFDATSSALTNTFTLAPLDQAKHPDIRYIWVQNNKLNAIIYDYVNDVWEVRSIKL